MDKILSNSKFERYFLFFINVYIFIFYGMLSGSFGLTLNQFGQILSLDTRELAAGFSTQAIFGCIASLLATYTLAKWNRNLQYAFDVLFLSIIIILFPFSNSSAEYLFYSSAIGFFTSVINCVNTIWTVELFRDNPSFFIQLLFLFYPLGSTFSRVLFSPFLDNSDLITSSINNTISHRNLTSQNHTSIQNELSSFDLFFDNMNKTYIWVPYLVLGSMMLFGSMMVFYVHFFDPFRRGSKTNEINNNEIVNIGDNKIDSITAAAMTDSNQSKENRSLKNKSIDKNEEQQMTVVTDSSLPDGRSPTMHKILSFVFVMLVCIIIALQVGCETNFFNFIPTFLTKIDTFDFNETQASWISICLTICVCVGRIFNIFLSLRIETEFMIYVNFLLILIGNLVLIFLSHQSVAFIWTGIGLVGLRFSATYPLIIAFVEKRYRMSSRLSSLIEFSSLLFVCFSPMVFGHILDNTPQYFIYINSVIDVVILCIFCIINLMGSFRNDT